MPQNNPLLNNAYSLKNNKKYHVKDPNNSKEPLAIIGIGCRLPGNIFGADDMWQALKEGRDCITDIPEDRWNIEKYYDPDPDKSEKIRSKKGGFIKNMKEFDAEFFDIYPKIAHALDPRQRHLLEVVYEAIEDSGMTIENLSGTETAVMMGIFLGDEIRKFAGSDLTAMNAHTTMGSADTTVPARVAYNFNLTGPVLAIDTACSSSLVAVDSACKAIWSGDAKMAIAGGVNIMTSHENTLALSKGGFLSPDGYCKSFDASGNGYVRGEGVGVVIIKPLSQAQQDGDDIYCVIRNTVVNFDGFTSEGITVPNELAQAKMLDKAYNDIGIQPCEVDFIEAHGTGTSVGDPKECFAFGKIFAKERSNDKPLLIGSIKSNIGHTEAVSGISGLIKLALCIKNKEIPKNLHFKNPNPKIKFDEWKLKVVDKLTTWPQSDLKKAIGGVNSFGAGGTNAHAVLEEYVCDNTKLEHSIQNNNFPYFFILSAKSKTALIDLSKKYINFLDNNDSSLRDICYSLNFRRSILPEKLVIISYNKQNIIAALEAFINDKRHEGLITNSLKKLKVAPKIALICSGQGPQWYAMGRQLMSSSKLFYDVIKKIDKIFNSLSGYSLLEEMNKSSEESNISQTRVAQPSIMAIQIGLIEIYKSFGLKIAGIAGHSIGEVAAAYCAGALNLKQAVEVIYSRSKEQDKASGKGSMLAVGLDYSKALSRIRGKEGQISIAAINGPEMLVLSGDTEPLREISKSLEKEEIFNKFLKINVPFHSHHMDITREGMLESLKNLKPRKTKIPLYSTVTGVKESGPHLTAKYWFNNVRDTVYFTNAVEKMIEDGFNYFIEIAPNPVLGGGIDDILIKNNKSGEVISSLSRKIQEFEANINYEAKDILNSLAKIYLSNNAINFISFYDKTAKYVKLPKYAWQHQKYWVESKEHQDSRLKKDLHPFIKDFQKNIYNNNLGIWQLNLNKDRELFLNDHQIEGTIVFPGAAQLEIAHEIAKQNYDKKFSHLENIKFPLALFLDEENKTSAQSKLEIISDFGDYKIFSRQKESEKWKQNSSGKICYNDEEFISKAQPLEDLKKRLVTIDNQANIDDFYNKLKTCGLNYGKHFKLAQEIWQNGNEILAKIEVEESDKNIINQFNLLPTIADSCLHVIIKKSDDGLYLPDHYDKYKIFNKKITTEIWSYAKVTNYDSQKLVGDITSYNKNGNLILEAQGVNLKYLENSRSKSSDVYDGIYEYQWQKLDLKKDTKVTAQNQNVILLFGNDLAANFLADKFKKDKFKTLIIKYGDNFEFSKENYQVNPQQKGDFTKLFTNIVKNNIKISKIINLWPLSFKFNENKEDFLGESNKLIAPSLYLSQEIIRLEQKLEIYQITNGADLVDEKKDQEINFIQGSLYGMARVFVNEYLDFEHKMVDIGYGKTKQDLEALYKEVTANTDLYESEVALRSYGRFTRKLVKLNKKSEEEKLTKKTIVNSLPFKSEIEDRNIIFRQSNLSKINDDEILIEVKYFGLISNNNYKQLSGVVKNIGPKVSNFRINDEVITLSKDSYSNYITVKEDYLCKKPKNITLKESCLIIIPYLAAYFILNNINKIDEGNFIFIDESLEINLQNALINLAKSKKAQIISATQNSNIDHKIDKKLNFFAQINEITGGNGINIALASSKKDNLLKILQSMAEFSAVNIINNEDKNTNLVTHQGNVSVRNINFNQLLASKSLSINNLLSSVKNLVENNKEIITNSKITSFEINKINQALKASNGLVQGNIVLEVAKKIDLLPNNQIEFKNNVTYLITGGTTGLGLTLAVWLFSKGARNFALMSRSGPKYEKDFEIINELRESGANIVWQEIKTDVGKVSNVINVVNYIKENMPPLKGVIHSAGILEDATYPNMDMEKFNRVFTPKANGAWNLHQATENLELELFLMISSVSSIIGISGQNNYSAANSFLNYLALYRKSRGLVANSACLGLLDPNYAGMSKKDPKVVEMASKIVGLTVMSQRNLEDKLEIRLLSKSSYGMISLINWKNYIISNPKSIENNSLKDLLKTDISSKNITNNNFKETLLSQNLNERIDKTLESLGSLLSDILGISLDDIDSSVSINEFGFDSLILNQFRNSIKSKFEVNVSLMQLAKGPTLHEMSNLIIDSVLTDISDKNNSNSLVESVISSDMNISIDKWFISREFNKVPKIKIFCLHPVGSGASIFSQFIFNPPKNTELVLIQMPGRENRLNEDFYYKNVEELVLTLANKIADQIDGTSIFWGHSWGGVSLFEILKYLRRTNNPKFNFVKKLIITGSIAPHLTKAWKNRDSIKETSRKSNTIDKIISTVSYLEDEKFLRNIIPVMRKDMEIIMTYNYRQESKLDIPILAFGAIEDEVVLLKEIERWEDLTNSDFTLHKVHGDHWFLSRNKHFILNKIQESLSGLVKKDINKISHQA